MDLLLELLKQNINKLASAYIYDLEVGNIVQTSFVFYIDSTRNLWTVSLQRTVEIHITQPLKNPCYTLRASLAWSQGYLRNCSFLFPTIRRSKNTQFRTGRYASSAHLPKNGQRRKCEHRRAEYLFLVVRIEGARLRRGRPRGQSVYVISGVEREVLWRKEGVGNVGGFLGLVKNGGSIVVELNAVLQ